MITLTRASANLQNSKDSMGVQIYGVCLGVNAKRRADDFTLRQT